MIVLRIVVVLLWLCSSVQAGNVVVLGGGISSDACSGKQYGNTTAMTASSVTIDGWYIIRISFLQADASCSINKGYLYTKGRATNCKMLIYSNESGSGNSGSLVAVSNVLSVADSVGWKEFNFSSSVNITASHYYQIAVICSGYLDLGYTGSDTISQLSGDYDTPASSITIWSVYNNVGGAYVQN